jgi:hypothetical protein
VETRREGTWMHYRLADAMSPVIQAVLDAALHALTHARGLDRDVARLKACIQPSTVNRLS